MMIAAAIVVLLLGLFGWLGQVVSAVAPAQAARWGLTEPEKGVDRTFLADVRAEAIWDALSLWTLPLAAGLLLADRPSWTLWGLVGGAMFLYFGGRGIAQRLVMRRRSIPIGSPAMLPVFVVFLSLWGLAGAATMGLAGHTLLGRM